MMFEGIQFARYRVQGNPTEHSVTSTVVTIPTDPGQLLPNRAGNEKR